MSSSSPGKVPALLALVLALAALGALGYAYFEPLIALDKLRAGSYGDPNEGWIRASIEGRIREAGAPLLAGCVASGLALLLALLGRNAGGPAKLALLLALVASAAAGFLAGTYGEVLSRAL